MSVFSQLFKTVVVSGMQTGFRRAGVTLEKGENHLELDESQVKVFQRDPNLKIDVLDVVQNSLIENAADAVISIAAARLGIDAATVAMVIDTVEAIKANPDAKASFVDGLKEQAINIAANAVIEGVNDKINDVAEGIVEDKVDGLDLSSVDEFLHPLIVIIDDMNKEKPLDKKPSVGELVYQVPGENQGDEPITVKPTALQRDEAWAWYQANVKIVGVDASAETGNA